MYHGHTTVSINVRRAVRAVSAESSRNDVVCLEVAAPVATRVLDNPGKRGPTRVLPQKVACAFILLLESARMVTIVASFTYL